MGDELLDRIREVEAQSGQLDPDAAGRAVLRDQVVAYGEAFLQSIPERPAYHLTPDLGAGLSRTSLGEEGRDVGAVLELLKEYVDGPGLNPTSPRFLGYIPGGGLYASALGDYLADVTNRYAGVFFGGPGAVRLENLLLRWAADLVGYPPEMAGAHVSGGSLANLIALVAAREARSLSPADFPKAVVYLTEQTHFCVTKALQVLGMGGCVVRHVALDQRYRMVPADLARQLDEDRGQGLTPWVVVASAGTTDVGAVDPLEAIAEVTASHGVWYHVDAAYGGFFQLTEHGRRILKGMERSDSIVLDPHKSLFLPYGSGLVLVRDGKWLEAANRYDAGYMQDARKARDELAPADLSPELTRPFRALRLWLPLMLHGLAPFRAALEEKLLLTRYLHREVARLGCWVGPEPDLSVTVFRYVPERFRGDASPKALEAVDRYNERLQEDLVRDGRIMLSSTRLDGRFTIRLAVLVFRTHLEDVQQVLEVLTERIEALGR